MGSKKQTLTEVLEGVKSHKLGHLVTQLLEIGQLFEKDVVIISKWNSVTFSYKHPLSGFEPLQYLADLMVVNLSNPERMLLILPNGMYLNHAQLEGQFKDGRRMISITSDAVFTGKKELITSVLEQLIAFAGRYRQALPQTLVN